MAGAITSMIMIDLQTQLENAKFDVKSLSTIAQKCDTKVAKYIIVYCRINA